MMISLGIIAAGPLPIFVVQCRYLKSCSFVTFFESPVFAFILSLGTVCSEIEALLLVATEVLLMS